MKKPRLRAPSSPSSVSSVLKVPLGTGNTAWASYKGSEKTQLPDPFLIQFKSTSSSTEDQLCDGCTTQRVVCSCELTLIKLRTVEVQKFASRAVRIDQNEVQPTVWHGILVGSSFCDFFSNLQNKFPQKKSANIFPGKIYSRDKYSWPVHRRCFIVLFDNLRARRRNVCFRRLTSEVI